MSVWNTSHSIGAFVALVICGYVVSLGWRWCFYIPAIIAAFGVLLIWVMLRDTPTSVGLPEITVGKQTDTIEQKKSRKEFKAILIKRVFCNPYIWILSIANFFVYTVRFAFLDWGPTMRNHYRLTPFAITKPTWLTMADYVSSEQPDEFPWKKVCLIHFTGYLDFHPDFFQGKFQSLGMGVNTVELDLAKVSTRKNTLLEMRSTNIARLFDNEEALDNFVRILTHEAGDADVVLLPACLGLERTNVVNVLSRKLGIEVKLLATFPPTVSGIRAQYLLKQRFLQLGGTYMLGDTVNQVDFEGDRVSKIFTVNHVMRKYLHPGEKPVAVFMTDATDVVAREYCNLHGHWMSV